MLEKIKGQDVPPLVDSGAVLVTRKIWTPGDPSAAQMTTSAQPPKELLRMEGVEALAQPLRSMASI